MLAPWLALAACQEPTGSSAPQRRERRAAAADAARAAATAAAPEPALALPAWAEPRPGAALWSGQRTVRGRVFSFAFWDSRRIALTLVPGRVDPGGSGVVPEPIWSELVAAFNGGFRSVHGHYGLRAEDREFLPPRTGLATLARAADGGWWLGTLLDPGILQGATAFRQNLPPLLEHGRFDPTGAGSFGAMAPGKRDGRTTRSALGLRADGVLAYVYGIDVTAEELASAAHEGGAVYAMGLDINDGQAGFEWLAIGGPSVARRRAPSKDAMQTTWQGTARGRAVRAERLTVPMGISLPRWLSGDPRDYFVLSRSAEALPAARLGATPPSPRKEK